MKGKTFTHYFLCLFALGALTFAVDAQDVLPAIYSPGFEEPDAMDVWEDWDNSVLNEDASYVHNGAFSLKVEAAGGGVGQLIEEFSPETEISLLGWAIADAANNAETYIGFYFDDEEFKSRLDAVKVNVWRQLCVTATIPAGTGELYVYFWYDGDTAGVANTYVDDFEVKWGNECQYMGIDDPETLNSSVSVYPNPTTGPFQISIGEKHLGSSCLEIFDVTGNLISRVNDLTGRKNIPVDLSSFPAGMYVGTINSEAGIHTFKIIRK